MEELEEKIHAVLSDPAQMEQIMNMARALGLSGAAEAQERTDDTPSEPPQPSEMMREPVAQLIRQAGKPDAREENLLNALKPFLKPSRREKIDRAMQVARLSHLAGYALRNLGGDQT